MKDVILSIIKDVVAELNEELEYDTLRAPNEQTKLYGGEDGIDSLSLVRVVSDVESRVNEKFDVTVLLADEKAMSRRNSPYQSIGAFADFIAEKIGEEKK